MIKNEFKVTSVEELLKYIDKGYTTCIIKLIPAIAYTKTICKTAEGKYLVSCFTKGKLITKEQLQSEPEHIKNQIEKERVWIKL